MKAIIAGLGSLMVGLAVSASAAAQEYAPPQYGRQSPQGPQYAPGAEDASQAPAVQPAPQVQAPEPAPAVYSYPTGQWVYGADRVPIWVPAGAASVAVGGVPYAYLYTPAYGWAWCISPWGWGPYRYGSWGHYAGWGRYGGWGWGRGWGRATNWQYGHGGYARGLGHGGSPHAIARGGYGHVGRR
jgi:hypothetical protein